MKKISREKRIEEILTSLFKGERFSSEELKYKYEVNIRVIQKDLKFLRDSGYIIKKSMGKYYIPDEYILKDTQNMHPLAMDMAMSIVNKTLPKYKEVIQDSLNVELNNIFEFDFEIEEIKNEKLFLELKKAITKKLAIKFLYKNHTKNIYPLKIINFYSYWYLIGYDLEENIVKTFYLDNIASINFYKESYLDINDRKKLENLEITSAWYNGEKKKIELILFSNAKKYILRRTPSNIKVLQNNNDNLEIEFSYFNEIELLNFIKKWLGYIKIKDEKLKLKIKKEIEQGLTNL